MYTQTTPRVPAHIPPCCPNCWAVMSITTTEPWTLLRGNQLNKYTFECNECGYSTSSIVQDEY
jgi:hypothetical protein